MGCEPGCPVCERLRAAALELVGEGGIENLSLEGLAARTGREPAEVTAHYATSSECVYETYDEVACDLRREMVDAFGEASDWQEGFEISRKRMLERLAVNPSEARLCFVETLRGDRELRRRRELNRRSLIEFLTQEYARAANGDGMRPIQIELLIGAGFQVISTAVAQDGGLDLAELDSRLTDLESCFLPVHA
jgi:AcrR family transcriptional regulator